MHWPFQQYASARGARRSPFHEALLKAGAVMGEQSGWERPNWFAPEGVEPVYRYSYGRQNWFEHTAAECRAVRDAIGLFDQSSFSKCLVTGPDSCAVLNRICANEVNRQPRAVVYTQWLNERGGIEADLTVTRLAETEFLVVSTAAGQTRDFAWLKRHIPEDARCSAVDVTSGLPMLGLMGPNSRALLEELSGEDLSNDAFPFATSKEIEIGYARVRASRITYVGELGWELYIPAEFAMHVFERIGEAGPNYGLVPAGYHAMNACRMEKAYRHFGHDIGDEDTPLEAGLAFAVAFEKPAGFIGRDALLRQREAGVARRRLVQFRLEDGRKNLYHEEPIYRDGELVGSITSGMYGHRLGASLGMGYLRSAEGVTRDYVEAGSYEIEIAAERVPAKAQLQPFYDPTMARVKT
jgi:4-methylaminobutanoate oxidase (formaldehyde-forming)